MELPLQIKIETPDRGFRQLITEDNKLTITPDIYMDSYEDESQSFMEVSANRNDADVFGDGRMGFDPLTGEVGYESLPGLSGLHEETDEANVLSLTGGIPLEETEKGKIFHYYLREVQKALGLKPNQCFTCGSYYSSFTRLALHQGRCTGLRVFACKVCGKEFPTGHQLGGHQRIHSKFAAAKKEAKMPKVKVMKQKSPLKTMKAKTDENSSPLSGSNFNVSASHFLSQLYEDNPSPSAPKEPDEMHKCTYCNKFFKKLYNVKEHERMHEELHRCSICSKVLSSSYALQDHLIGHNVSVEEESFSCPTCGKSFDTAVGLKVHTKVHGGKTTLGCVKCQKRFNTSEELEEHMATHVEREQFNCDHCDSKFFDVSTLNRHLKMHKEHKHSAGKGVPRYVRSQEKDRDLSDMEFDNFDEEDDDDDEDYRARHVDKTFEPLHEPSSGSSEAEQEEEAKAATGIIYKCDLCGKGFDAEIQMRKHLAYHTKNKQIPCQFCNKKCFDDNTLKRHMKIHKKNNKKSKYYTAKYTVKYAVGKTKDHTDTVTSVSFDNEESDTLGTIISENISEVDTEAQEESDKKSSASLGYEEVAGNTLDKVSTIDDYPLDKVEAHQSPDITKRKDCENSNMSSAVVENKEEEIKLDESKDELELPTKPVCDVPAKKKTLLTRRFECKYCDAKFKHRQMYTKHLSSIHPMALLCGVCAEKFGTMKQKFQHERAEHANSLKCRHCGKIFLSHPLFTRHHVLQVAPNKKFVKCGMCSKQFCTEFERHTHIERAHGSDGPCSCTYCGRQLSSRYSLARHEKIHLHKRDHICSFCHKSYVEREILNRHLRIHTGYKTYSCLYCTYLSPSQEALKKHEQTKHPGSESLTCAYCDFTGSSKTALEVHVHFSHSSKPLNCRYCNLTLSSKEELLSHEKIHSEDEIASDEEELP